MIKRFKIVVLGLVFLVYLYVVDYGLWPFCNGVVIDIYSPYANT